MSTSLHLEAIIRHLRSRFDIQEPEELTVYGTLSGTDNAGIFTTWTYFRVLDENFEVLHMGAISAETHPMRSGITILVWSSTEYIRQE